MSISSLPQSNRSWSIAVRTAYQKLECHQIYYTGSSYVNSGSIEAHRLQHYGQAIISDAYPLLLLLSETAESEGLPLQWIENVSADFMALLALIDETWMQAKDEYVKSTTARMNLKYQFSSSAIGVSLPQPVGPVYTTVTRKRGRPRKSVDPKILHEAFQKGRQISTTVLANILGISRKTLQARKKELEIDSSFDNISDADLDDLVRIYHQENPAGGRSYIMGHLRATHALRIQRQRVVDAINRVDKLGQGMRQRIGKKKLRRKYSVPRPNALMAYRWTSQADCMGNCSSWSS
jgi:hypothetical protein